MNPIVVLLAVAQASLPAPPPAKAPEITVVAPRVPEGLNKQVRAASAEAPSGELARWRVPLCPRSEGLPPAMNAYFETRITEIARRVGAPVDTGKCAPNLRIGFTTDIRSAPRLFTKLSRFKWGSHRNELSDGAVEILTLSGEMPADGSSIQTACVGGHCFLMVDHAQASLVVSNVVATISQCIAVVDTTKLQGVRLGALSAALALNCLAQLNAKEIWPDSVSNALAGGGAKDDIQPSDIRYLRALYTLHGDTRASAESAQIARDIRGGN